MSTPGPRQSMVGAFVLASIAAFGAAPAAPAAPEVRIAKGGKALVAIHAAVGGEPDDKAAIDQLAAADLAATLKRMTGADFELRRGPLPAKPGAGIYVGQAGDLGPLAGGAPALEGEAFCLRTTPAGQVLVIGGSPRGVSHGVYTLLEMLGCRWYFPHPAWTVVPHRPDLSVSVETIQRPDFDVQRTIWVGHGLHSPAVRRDYDDWMRRNRMGKAIQLVTSHSWPGIDPTKDFQAHPEWFGLVDGQRKAAKPCYSNPEVIARGVERALAYFRADPRAQMISVSAPDGVGFCECDRCRRLAKAVRVYKAHGPGAVFAETADGRQVSLASETIFHYANEVARAVEREFPGKYVGILAYSSYAHPPSFDLRANVYVELTRGYRRTPLTFDEQLAEFARRARSLGIYEYYDVEQWSWDLPGSARAADLDGLAGSIGQLHRRHIRSLTGEMSNNWAPNGIGYYVISRLLWDAGTDARAVEEEFYRLAFGPAGEHLKRLYRRWESGQGVNARTLALAHRDLQAAAEAARDRPACLARVDQIRMYLHFLTAYVKPPEAKKLAAGDPAAGKAKIDHLGRYVGRLMDTGMVHSWAFNRYLKEAGEALGCDTSQWPKPARIPTAEEVAATFRADANELDLPGAQDVPVRLFSRRLAAVKPPGPAPAAGAAPSIQGGWTQWLLVQAGAGQIARITFAAEGPREAFFIPREAFERGADELAKRRADIEPADANVLALRAPEAGYFQVNIARHPPLTISHPAVMTGGKGANFSRTRLYFFVPARTRRFLLIAHARGGPSVTVRDAAGKVVLQARRSARDDFIIDVPPGDDGGVWSVEGTDDPIGYGTVRLVGVPNYFSLLPDGLLAPAEALR